MEANEGIGRPFGFSVYLGLPLVRREMLAEFPSELVSICSGDFDRKCCHALLLMIRQKTEV